MVAKKANERLEEKKKKRQQLTLVVVIAGAILVILAIGYSLMNGQGGPTATYNQSRTDAGGLNVLTPLSDITDTDFHFFSYNSSGTAIKYFVVKDKSGNVHTAFDACDVCFRSKKGYHQAGDSAQCNNCGKTFAVNDIGTKNTAGGCWPGYLLHEVQGNNIVIKIPDLEGGKHYFP